jgi:hypothetical protein
MGWKCWRERDMTLHAAGRRHGLDPDIRGIRHPRAKRGMRASVEVA